MGKVNQPQNLLDQIRTLRRRIEEVAKKVGLASAVISRGGLRVTEGGDITIEDGGHLRVNHPSGFPILYVGRSIQGRYFVRINRQNGQSAFDLAYNDASDTQYFALRDNEGNILFSDNTIDGEGIATPRLPIALQLMPGDEWLPGATGTGFQTMAMASFTKWCHGIHMSHIVTKGSSDTEIRITLDDDIIATFPFSSPEWGPWPVPGDIGSAHTVNVYVRRIGGDGARTAVTVLMEQI